MNIPVTLPGALPSDTTRIIRDRAGVFDAFTPTTIAGEPHGASPTTPQRAC